MSQSGEANGGVLNGVIPGIVTNVLDIPPLGDSLNRVKVAFPQLSPAWETNWARVVNFGAGKEQGSLFTPEVGDEVLVAFEFGDPRRPYVLGGLQNKKTTVDYGGMGGKQVSPLGLGGKVAVRGFVTRAAKLLIEDMPMPEGLGAKLTLGMNTDKQGIVIDQKGGTLDINCEPAPPESATPSGALTIKVGDLGSITIQAGATGSITVKTGAGGKISIGDSTSDVEINGKTIKLSGTMSTEVSGPMIKLG
jgi:phage baseplate assembly protein gpV